MNPTELLDDLKARGAEFRVEGEQLFVSLPDGEFTLELREDLTRNKPEIIMALQAEASVPKDSPFAWGGRSLEEVMAMPTGEFRYADIAVVIESYLLREEIVLVSNLAVAQRLKGDPRSVYLPEEIALLEGLEPDEIRRLHTAKKIVGGRIMSRAVPRH